VARWELDCLEEERLSTRVRPCMLGLGGTAMAVSRARHGRVVAWVDRFGLGTQVHVGVVCWLDGLGAKRWLAARGSRLLQRACMRQREKREEADEWARMNLKFKRNQILLQT
jgi:hypothetical protein